MEIKLGHKKDIQYTDDVSLQSFCDVKIISADHQLFYINRSLLAVHSQLFRQILSNLSTVPFLGDEIAISTNLKSDDLFAIVEFMVKGSIQIFTDPLFEGTELSVDPELSESFEAMGIPVKSLNLSPETVSNLSQMETEASDWGPSVFPDFEEDENYGLDFEDGNDSVELSKPKRGRPRKNEVRTPSRKLSPPKNKLYSPPFADEFQDPESIMPKDYKGRNLKLPHINLYRWKFLPPFAKERLLCKANGLEVPIRRKRQRKESEELMSEDPVESTSFEFAPRSLRERITNPSFESDAIDDDDIQQMKEEPIDDSDISYDENEAVAKEEHDDYRYPKRKRGKGSDLTPIRQVPRSKQGPRASVLFYFPTEGDRDLNKKYQCTKCTRGFGDQTQFQQHLRRHESKSEKEAWYCLTCTTKVVVFEHMQDLHRHRMTAHKNAHLTCPHCNKLFNGFLVNKFKRHVREHEQPREYFCIACGAKFHKQFLLKQHQQQAGDYHNGQCVTCQQEFISWSDHKEHVNKSHKGIFKHICGLCPAIFNSSIQAQVHRKENCPNRSKEPKENKINFDDPKPSHDVISTTGPDSNTKKTLPMCEQCGKTFANVNNYLKHTEDHHGPEKLLCSECPKVLLHKNSLDRHILRFHAKFPCEHCGALMTKGKYSNHIFTHHTPDHMKPYICNVCQKGFGSKKSYVEHMNIHSSLRPYSCRYCTATFNSKGNWYAHERTLHKGIKREKKTS